MRAFIVGSVVLVGAIAAITAGSGQLLAQSGYDRPGGDYASAPVPSGDPAVCSARCEHDNRCRSWSFSYPSASGSPATCRLKREVVRPVQSNCCVSGVRGAGVIEPRLGEFEYSIDRSGGDYRSFEAAPGSRGHTCAEACRSDLRCRAWTYRRTGYGTVAARCYLKETIRPPRRRPCCISGVVR